MIVIKLKRREILICNVKIVKLRASDVMALVKLILPKRKNPCSTH